MPPSRFKIGDLVILSKFGRMVIVPNPAKIGIVLTGPEHHLYECTNSDTTIKYCTFDVMFGPELLTNVPEDFLMRMESDNHPDNPQGLEEHDGRTE